MATVSTKIILIPTDFSNEASYAVDYGILLAKKLNAKILLLHAFHFNIMIDMNGQAMNTSEIAKELEDINREKLKSLSDSLKNQYPDIQIDSKQVMGLLVDVIKELVENETIDYVVMGTKGATGIDEYILGSNTALIVESVKCPVWVIPHNSTIQEFKKIVYATDFLFEDIDNIDQVAQIAQLFDATLQVVHITQNTVDEKHVQKWFGDVCKDRCKYDSLAFRNIPLQKDTLSTLNSLIDKEGIDLVVMNSSGKNFLKRLFSGSLTQKMAYHSHIPFLAFHKTAGKS